MSTTNSSASGRETGSNPSHLERSKHGTRSHSLEEPVGHKGVIRELVLFAGGGGDILGSVLAGWSTRCAVEIDPRCRKILLARQRDGILDRFPIWDDVQSFDGKPWRGHIDLVSGGYPCPRWSTARRGRGETVDLWPDQRRIVGEVEPRYVLSENVQRPPIERSADDLRRLGYRCVIFRAPASAVGAAHRRDRWWVAADAYGEFKHLRSKHDEVAGLRARANALWSEHPAGDPNVAHGLARGVDVHPRSVGNGQVPQVVLAIARALGWTRH